MLLASLKDDTIVLVFETKEEIYEYTEEHAHKNMIEYLDSGELIEINELGGYCKLNRDQIESLSKITDDKVYSNQKIMGVLK